MKRDWSTNPKYRVIKIGSPVFLKRGTGVRIVQNRNVKKTALQFDSLLYVADTVPKLGLIPLAWDRRILDLTGIYRKSCMFYVSCDEAYRGIVNAHGRRLY